MILIVLVVSLALRLIAINQSLWLDEGINVNVAKALDYFTLAAKYSLSDFHPPLYHLVLKSWILFFGSSEVSVRIPSVIFALGSIFFVYKTAQKLYEEKTALIAATLLATAPLHIYYSQEARMYMMAAFFASASSYFFISVLKKDNLANWSGFVIATGLMLWTDYLPYLLIPSYVIYLLVNRKRISKSALHAFLPAFVLIFIFISPWLLILPNQLGQGLSTAAASPAWAEVVGSTSAKSLAVTFVKLVIGRISHQNDLYYAALFAPAGLFAVFLFILSFFRISHLRSYLWYWLILPIFLAFLISFYIPVFAYFRLLFVLGAFYILWASAINTVNWAPLVRTLLAGALIINFVATTIYFINPKFQREDWKGAANYVIKNSDKNTIVLFESSFTTGPFDYYNSGRVNASGSIVGFSAKNPETGQKVKVLTKEKKKVFLFQYLSQITDPQGLVFEQLTKNGFTNVSTKDFNGVGFVYEFAR